VGANVGGVVGVVGEVKVLEIRKLLQYMATSSEWRQLCDPIPLFEQEVRRDSKPVQPTSSSQIFQCQIQTYIKMKIFVT